MTKYSQVLYLYPQDQTRIEINAYDANSNTNELDISVFNDGTQLHIYLDGIKVATKDAPTLTNVDTIRPSRLP